MLFLIFIFWPFFQSAGKPHFSLEISASAASEDDDDDDDDILTSGPNEIWHRAVR